MTAYYNEIDPYAAQWLRNLIDAGHIAPGIVDTRSIEDVLPNELTGFTQCHFFAGIGVWSYALRRAGWPDDRPVWTGSCPCQPFSSAGQGGGFDDQRHLWPHFFHLIEQCKPPVVFGEQVASRDANAWIDLVQDDLEGVGYGVGAVPFPSAGVGAPHIRDRLYWMADSGRTRPLPRAHAGIHRGQESAGAWDGKPERHGTTDRMADAADQRQHGRWSGQACDGRYAPRIEPERLCDAGGVGHAGYDHDAGQEPTSGAGQPQADRPADQPGGSGVSPSGLADTKHDGRPGPQIHQTESCGDRKDIGIPDRRHPVSEGQPAAGPTNGHWSAADWLLCRDGKWRPVEPGTFPLAHGASARVGRLRAYGNAINAEAARVFIEACM